MTLSSTHCEVLCLFFFFFNDTATTEIYTLSLHDALPISVGPYTLLRVDRGRLEPGLPGQFIMLEAPGRLLPRPMSLRSEEHTSELQSQSNLVCRLLLEKKKVVPAASVSTPQRRRVSLVFA